MPSSNCTVFAGFLQASRAVDEDVWSRVRWRNWPNAGVAAPGPPRAVGTYPLYVGNRSASATLLIHLPS